MGDDKSDSSFSGYLSDSFEGISASFTDIQTVKVSGSNVLSKAKRYGKWWLLKSIIPEKSDDELYRQRLRKEFEILIQFQNPEIVSAIGLEDVDTLGKCIVMEYIDGVTLGDWLKTSPSRSRRRAVAASIVQALEYVHSKGVVHRDIKPSNIMVTRTGERVVLIDFGLADSDSHAVFKQPAGTPEFMPEEQFTDSEADPRNDIYSLGKVFSQMNLGYGRAVKRCLKPIDARYQNLSELKRDLKSGNLFRIMAAAFVIIVIGIIFTVLIRKDASQDENVAKIKPINSNTAIDYGRADVTDSINLTDPSGMLPDSLLASINSILDSENKTDINLPNESTDTKNQLTLNSENYTEIYEQEMKDPKMREAAKKAREATDQCFFSMDVFKHIDTLSDIRYYREDIDYDSEKYDRFYRNYRKNIEKSFTPNQTLIIMGEILKEVDTIKEIIYKKYDQLTMKRVNEYKEKHPEIYNRK